MMTKRKALNQPCDPSVDWSPGWGRKGKTKPALLHIPFITRLAMARFRHRQKPRHRTRNDNKLNDDFQTIDVTLKCFADADFMCSAKAPKLFRNLKCVVTANTCDDKQADCDYEVEAADLDPKTKKCNTRIQVKEEHEDFNFLNILPLEIWHKISDYILPKDILSFALICKRTYNVVNMPSFWIRLYKRYSLSNINVPLELQHYILERSQVSLKMKVVRSLFFSYPPFVKLENKFDNYEKILGMQCVSNWVKSKCDSKGAQEGFCWVYTFKLGKIQLDRKFRGKEGETLPVNHNPDSGKIILRIMADNYCFIEPIFGLKMRKFQYNSLTNSVYIEFGPAHLPMKSKVESTNVYIYTILEGPPAVFEWWHPLFYE